MAHTYLLTREQWLPRPLDEIFYFFSRPNNLQVITPPWLDFHITQSPDTLKAGSLIRYKLRIHGIPVDWTTEITDWNPTKSFVDEQISGPYTLWRHEHTFTAERNGTTVRDAVHYTIPYGAVGRLAHWLLVKRDLKQIFDYRQNKMRELFGRS